MGLCQLANRGPIISIARLPGPPKYLGTAVSASHNLMFVRAVLDGRAFFQVPCLSCTLQSCIGRGKKLGLS